MASVAMPSAEAQAGHAGFGWTTLMLAFLGGGLLTWALEGATPAHLQLALCLLTSLAWMVSRADASVVALVGATAVACAGVLEPGAATAPLEHLGDDTTVLIIAAFVLAKAIERSGLAHAVADCLTGRQGRGAYGRLAAGVFATTFLIPSTAARASVLVPLVDRVKSRTTNAHQRRATALMSPLVVVLGAFASPVAAGANLLAIQMLAGHTDTPLSFAMWIQLALPFATLMVLATVIAAWFTCDREAPTATYAEASTDTAALAPTTTGDRLRVAGVLLLALGLWSSTAWHPLEPMLIAVVAAVLVTLPGFGVLSLKDGLKSVDWSLIILLTAATYISDTLSGNPLVGAGVDRLAGLIGGDSATTGALVLAALALGAMLAHLGVTSRSARAALLLPPGLAIGAAAGLDPIIVALTIASATGFCILTPVGSKALMIFAGSSAQEFNRRVLVRTGLVLFPIQFALTLLFGLVIWPNALGSF